MTTKLDKVWAENIKDGVNALILEIERLEGQVGRIESDLSQDSVEWFIRTLPFEDPQDIHKTFVAGNIRNFANYLFRRLQLPPEEK